MIDALTNLYIVAGVVLIMLVLFGLLRAMYALGLRAGRDRAFVDATGWIVDRDRERRAARIADLVARQPGRERPAGPPAEQHRPYL